MRSKRYFVSGRVQGVFFRDSTQREATRLGLSGWVRNRVDGRVEVLASGDEADLIALEKWLKIGPQYAKVSDIETIVEGSESLDVAPGGRFEIRPTSA